MKKKPKVLLLTGNSLRHRYVANSLAGNLNLIAIVIETKRSAIESLTDITSDELSTIERHLNQRNVVEKSLLGNVDFPEREVLRLPEGGVNSLEAYYWILSKLPDLVLLYGTSVIKPPLLSIFEGRIINMHLGLSPYYRGAGTNFWPLVDRRPECVGTTIHLAVQKVDAGSILAQVRPEVLESDRSHEFGTKAIIAGVITLIATIKQYASGQLQPKQQDLTRGVVFKRKDFNANAVIQMWQNFDRGMVSEYLSESKERCARCPIVSL